MTQATEWKSHLICFYLSFVRTHTKFGIKIFEIDFVIEIKWYLTFWPLPRAPRVKKKSWCCTPHSCEKLTHKIWSNFFQRFRRRQRNRRTDGLMDGGNYNIPFAFLKKLGDKKTFSLQKVRIAALKCIEEMSTLPLHIVIPYRSQITRALESALDDRKRLVRKQAVSARQDW